MGSHISTPQNSPQLLGISFIENYRFYFQNEKYVDTHDVSEIMKNAFRHQKVSGEIESLLHEAPNSSKSDIVKKLQNINEKYPGDPNVSRLTFDLVQAKKKLAITEQHIEDLNKQIAQNFNSFNHETLIGRIKKFKHDRRQLESQLKTLQLEYKEIEISLYAAKHSIKILNKENNVLHDRFDAATTENASLHSDLHMANSRLIQLSMQINFFNSQLSTKNEQITDLQAVIKVKDDEFKELVSSIVNDSKDLDNLFDLIVKLEEQLIFKANEIRDNIKILDEAEYTFSILEEKINTMTQDFQLRISQLEIENSELRQKLGI